jgi:hypothetical protein
MNRIIKWTAASICAALSISSFARASQTTYPVTLNGLTIDSNYIPTVTDPGTGVVFSNAPNNGGGDNFIIDYFNADSSLPDITPGPVLSSEGFVPNGGVSAPADFGFTMTLPTPASGVNMIMDYASAAAGGPAGSVLLQGYNSSNTVVAMDQVTPPAGFFDEQPLALTSSSNNIVKVTLTPTNIADNFGAITYTVTNVPEPGSFLMLGIAAALSIRRRRRTTSC